MRHVRPRSSLAKIKQETSIIKTVTVENRGLESCILFKYTGYNKKFLGAFGGICFQLGFWNVAYISSRSQLGLWASLSGKG